MNCKQCGAPTVEGAVYCGCCGARVDGKKPCKACGQLNDESFAFCISCGTRIDGKTACTACGAVYEGAFCPTCGASAAQSSPVKKKKEGASAKRKGLFAFICETVSGAAMMMGVLLSLVFVFLIGLEALADGEVMEKVNIFTFFGEYYKDVEDLKISGMGLTHWWEELIEGQFTLYGVIGTVFSALTIICVAGFAIVAIIKYILSWTRKTENTANGWGLASVISFLAGAVFFYGYNQIEVLIDGVPQTLDMGMTTSFNGATATAIVLCACFVGLSVVFKLIGKGKASWTGKNLVGTVCSLVGVLFAGVVLAMSQYAGFGLDLSTASLAYEYEILEELGLDSAKLELLAGFGTFNATANLELSSIITPELGVKLYNALTADLKVMNVYCVISQLSVLALTVFSILSLYGNMRGTQGEKDRSLIWSACAVGSAVVLLIFSILTHEKFLSICADLVGDLTTGTPVEGEGLMERMLDLNFAIPICAVVFSMLMLAVAIVRSAICKKAKTQE